MKIALGSRSSSCMYSSSAQVQYLGLMGKTVNIWAALGGWVPRNLGTGADHFKPRQQEHSTSRRKHTHSMKHIKTKSTCKGKCIKMQQKTADPGVLEIALPQTRYRNVTLAAMQSIGCPPVHQSTRTNMSIKCQWKHQATTMQHTHSYPAMCEKNIFCVFCLSASQIHTFHQRGLCRKISNEDLATLTK